MKHIVFLNPDTCIKMPDAFESKSGQVRLGWKYKWKTNKKHFTLTENLHYNNIRCMHLHTWIKLLGKTIFVLPSLLPTSCTWGSRKWSSILTLFFRKSIHKRLITLFVMLLYNFSSIHIMFVSLNALNIRFPWNVRVNDNLPINPDSIWGSLSSH